MKKNVLARCLITIDGVKPSQFVANFFLSFWIQESPAQALSESKQSDLLICHIQSSIPK